MMARFDRIRVSDTRLADIGLAGRANKLTFFTLAIAHIFVSGTPTGSFFIAEFLPIFGLATWHRWHRCSSRSKTL
jgi:formate hydrogenlyase subunit 3/multisubunit Na+/H+ antiporter MnhD subunit